MAIEHGVLNEIFEALADSNRMIAYKMEEFADKIPPPILEAMYLAMRKNNDLMEVLGRNPRNGNGIV